MTSILNGSDKSQIYRLRRHCSDGIPCYVEFEVKGADEVEYRVIEVSAVDGSAAVTSRHTLTRAQARQQWQLLTRSSAGYQRVA